MDPVFMNPRIGFSDGEPPEVTLLATAYVSMPSIHLPAPVLFLLQTHPHVSLVHDDDDEIDSFTSVVLHSGNS